MNAVDAKLVPYVLTVHCSNCLRIFSFLFNDRYFRFVAFLCQEIIQNLWVYDRSSAFYFCINSVWSSRCICDDVCAVAVEYKALHTHDCILGVVFSWLHVETEHRDCKFAHEIIHIQTAICETMEPLRMSSFEQTEDETRIVHFQRIFYETDAKSFVIVCMQFVHMNPNDKKNMRNGRLDKMYRILHFCILHGIEWRGRGRKKKEAKNEFRNNFPEKQTMPSSTLQTQTHTIHSGAETQAQEYISKIRKIWNETPKTLAAEHTQSNAEYIQRTEFKCNSKRCDGKKRNGFAW